MTVEAKRRKRRRGVIGTVFSLLTIAALTYIAYKLLSGGGVIDEARLKRIFSGRAGTGYAAQYNFETGKSRVFADLDDGFVSMGTLGVQVLDYSGEETIREVFQASRPAVKASNGRAAAFDVGGTVLYVLNADEILSQIETTGAIISASINKNGWYSVCTQEGGGYKGAVTVYNSKGKRVYKSNFASGYVLGAALSEDNRGMAVLTLRETGSRITIYNFNSEDAVSYFELDGGVIIDIRYLPDGRVLAFGKDAVILVNKDGSGETLYNYSGRSLRKYAHDDGVIALYLSDYGIGSSGRLVTLTLKGALTERDFERELISLSIKNKQLAVLWSDGLSFYDSELNETGAAEKSDNAKRSVIALKDCALIAGEYSANVVFADEQIE